MPPTTDYVRHAARQSRKIQMDAALGGPPQVDAGAYNVLAKAHEEIAQGFEKVRTAD